MSFSLAAALVLGALTLDPSLTNLTTKTKPPATPSPAPLPEPEPLRLRLTLSDSSQVVGIPSVSALSVKTSFAEMAVPFERVRSATFSKDRAEIILVLSNGDRMTAAPKTADFQLTTIFGKARVELRHVTAIAVIPGGHSSAYPRDGLWGYWPLDGDAKDASGNSHDGVIQGAKPTEGVRGQAFNFDGKAAIEVGNPDFSKEQYSVAIWIRTDRPGRARDHRACFDKVDSSGGPFWMGIGSGQPDGAGDGFQYEVFNVFEPLVNLFSLDCNMRDGRWHHFAVTYKKGSQKVFIDGDLKAQNSYAGSLPMNSSPVAIGGHRFAACIHPWIGDLDEVFIYQRDLTDDEVQSLFRHGQSGK